ncbi:MAG: preprotein translocase subunit YajC [Alphaproteobacteria bacterium]|nr:preprotein translocase subunit YajC [Alphaproteobacteria bacterium]
MFISEAWAQGAGGGGDMITSFLPLILIFAVFYFLLIRPQQKKAKAHQEMISNLHRGDKVITGGGVHGTVTKVLNDADLMVEIAEGVRVRVAKGTVSALIDSPNAKRAKSSDGAGTPANDTGSSSAGGFIGKLLGKK